MIGLEGKRVLVTGGASGIGKATSIRFSDEGARVAVIDKDASACESLQSELTGLHQLIVVDVTDVGAVAHAFSELDAWFGGLDILINNAGVSLRRAFLDTSPEEWRRVIDVNLNGVFFVAQQAARRMWNEGSGVILNMGSTNGLIGYPNYAAYNASKAAVIELTRSMALELAPKVRVIAVCPGYVLTPMQEAEYTPKLKEELNKKIPLRRHAKPEEIAALIAFLASDEAPYITGHPIVIDGGEIAGGLASR